MENLQNRLRSIQVSQNHHKQDDLRMKIEAWNRIKAKAPELADFLVEIKRVFGKPERVNVLIGNEKVI